MPLNLYYMSRDLSSY